MKSLEEALNKMNVISVTGESEDRLMKTICCDSRKVTQGSIFVAINRILVNGNDYIDSAIEQGATTIVTDAEDGDKLPDNITKVVVRDARVALAQLSVYFYEFPSLAMNVIGITGTNGKTTVSYLIESIFKTSGRDIGRIGTVGYSFNEQSFPALTTTPESLDLQRMLRQMVDAGVKSCVLEVSSHALTQSRVDNVRFSTAVYTNLSRDHLDYHNDMEEYFCAKSLLFTKHCPKVAVVNADDPYSVQLIAKTEAKVYTYGLSGDVDVSTENLRIGSNGTSFTLCTPQGKSIVCTKLLGKHNVYNILAATGAALAEGISLIEIVKGVEALSSVPGRLETVDHGQDFAVAIDYAHTDDALSKAIQTAREITKGTLITVFGCGGDRDRSKRPLMGTVAWTLSDHVVVTSDNPRLENPQQIINDIMRGIRESDNPDGCLDVVIDRRNAIRKAILIASPGDFVLIAGKGHEDYQILGKKKTHFNDREEVVTALGEFYDKA